MSNVVGQLSLFDNEVVVDEAKPAKKQTYRPAEYPFQCNIWDRYVVVYAQHERQAYVKCKKMYGCCIGTPVQM